MSDKKSTVNNIRLALSSAPLEVHADIVYTECRAHISKTASNCSRLENEDELMQAQEEKLEIIENIYFSLEEIKNILWTAVEVSRLDKLKKNSNVEG